MKRALTIECYEKKEKWLAVGLSSFFDIPGHIWIFVIKTQELQTEKQIEVNTKSRSFRSLDEKKVIHRDEWNY